MLYKSSTSAVRLDIQMGVFFYTTIGDCQDNTTLSHKHNTTLKVLRLPLKVPWKVVDAAVARGKLA